MRVMNLALIAGLSTAVAFAAGEQTATADPLIISDTVGAGCVPGDPAIQFNRYFITAGSVNYPSGASGLITLYCPITRPLQLSQFINDFNLLFTFVPNHMTLTYTDGDGTGTASRITAQLVQIAKSNGALTQIPSSLIDSNTSATTTQTSITVTVSHSFNFFSNYYYVRVDMQRATGTSPIVTSPACRCSPAETRLLAATSSHEIVERDMLTRWRAA